MSNFPVEVSSVIPAQAVTIELSLVIPVYNEASHIARSLRVIASEVARTTESFELLVVDDGSRDATWEELSALSPELPSLRAVRLSRNFGKELALCAGLENARGDAVIIMDADLQHPPALISEMVECWRAGEADIVECQKRTRGKESLRNRLGAKAFYGLLQSLTGYDLQGASDFKLLDRKVVQAWGRMTERNTFFRGMSAWLGYRRTIIEFDVHERVDGSSNWNFFSLTRLAINAVVSFSSFPLRLVSFSGVAFLMLATLLAGQTLYQKFSGAAVTGFTTVILLLLIIGSIIMLSLGIIGEYLAAIYNEVKGRPRYLIAQRIDPNAAT